MASDPFAFEEDVAPAAPAASAPRDVLNDDADPLEAPAYGGEEPPEVEPEGAGADSFRDADGIVRLWLEDNRLVKVRLSPVWFHRVLGNDSLESHFRQAMLLSSLRMAEPLEGHDSELLSDVDGIPAELARLPSEVLTVFNGLPRIGPRSLAAFDRLFADMDARIAKADAEATSPARRPQVTGSVQGVAVTLNEAGFAVDVKFDQSWLDDAQVGTICAAVQAAADRAYAKYRPAEPEFTELDGLREERTLLLAAYRVMMNPRRDY